MTGNIILAGVGGQGILLSAQLIAAAAAAAGLDVKTNEIHGMAQRGGSVIALVKFGEKVHSPLILEGTATLLGAFEMIEALRNAHWLASDGTAVVARDKVIPVTVSSGKAAYPEDVEDRLKKVFPCLELRDVTAMAKELGNSRVANTILTGMISRHLELPEEVWTEAIKSCVKPKFIDINLKAFELGRGE